MTKRAQLADGTILEFPADTPDDVVDRVVKQHISGAKPAAPTAANSDFAAMVSGKPKPRSAGQEVGRQAGLTARYMLSGPLEFAGIFTDPIAQQLGLGSAREGAQYLGDKLGLPNPQGAAERVVGDVSKAVTGTGGLLGLSGIAAKSPGLVGSVGSAMSREPVLQGISSATGAAASSIARENDVGPGGQIVAGLAGGLAPSAYQFGGQGALRYLMRGGQEGREAMAGPDALNRLGIQGGRIADFRAAGATPSVGQATGNRRTQGLESLLSGAPTSNGVMTRFAEKQAQDIGAGLRAKANGLSPNPSGERAGLSVQRGVDSFTGDVKNLRGALYAQADKEIAPGTITPLSNTFNKLRQLVTPNPGAPNTTAAMVNPKIAALFENVGQDLAKNGGQGLPYEAVKDIRSKIGLELADFSLTTDKPTAQYKALYAALSQDLEQAAKTQGPRAYTAAQRANTYFRASQERLDTLQRVVDKAGGPEKVYQAALNGTQDGATTLRAVMRSLPQDSQKALSAAVVKRMGLATNGNQGAEGNTFSAQTFLTNWNKLSPEARSALFAPIGAKAGPFANGGRFVADMDKIARVAESIRNGSRVYANPAGTANRGLAYGYIGSLAASLFTSPVTAAGLIAGGVGSNALARAMTNPKFVSWLARATEIPATSAAQGIASLRSIAKEEKDSDLAAIADGLEKNR